LTRRELQLSNRSRKNVARPLANGGDNAKVVPAAWPCHHDADTVGDLSEYTSRPSVLDWTAGDMITNALHGLPSCNNRASQLIN